MSKFKNFTIIRGALNLVITRICGESEDETDTDTVLCELLGPHGGIGDILRRYQEIPGDNDLYENDNLVIFLRHFSLEQCLGKGLKEEIHHLTEFSTN